MIARILYTALLVGILTIGLACIVLGFHQLRIAEHFRRTTLRTPIDLIQGEVARITGVIEQHPDYELLDAPFSDESCVLRDWEIQEKRGSAVGGQTWKRVAQDVESVPCFVTTDYGSVHINLSEADELLLNSFAEPIVYKRDVTEDSAFEFITEQTDIDPRIGSRKCDQSLLSPGNEITVIGMVEQSEDPHETTRLQLTSDSNGDASFWEDQFVVTDWGRLRQYVMYPFALSGLTYGVTAVSVSLVALVDEFITPLFSGAVTLLLIGMVVIGTGYVFAADLVQWVHAKLNEP